jgi:hypothetical protein
VLVALFGKSDRALLLVELEVGGRELGDVTIDRIVKIGLVLDRT